MFLEGENSSGKPQIISGKFQNSGKFENNAIKDVKEISLSHVILHRTLFIQYLTLNCFFYVGVKLSFVKK